MRYQRNALRGSRPTGWAHPHPTRLNYESYLARLKGGGRATLKRLARMYRQEKSA